MKSMLACVVLILVLHGLAKADPPQAKTESKAKASGYQKSAAPDAAEYVGAETCEGCHGDLAKKFGTNPHAHLALTHAGKGVTCESCHGPGKAHADAGGDVTKILQFSKASPKQVDTTR